MKDIIVKLANIADELDDQNLVKESSIIDEVIRKIAQQMDVRPQSEWVEKVFLDFDNRAAKVYLKGKDFAYVYNDVDPELLLQIKEMHDRGERIGSVVKRELMEYPHTMEPIEIEEEGDVDAPGYMEQQHNMRSNGDQEGNAGEEERSLTDHMGRG